MVLIDVHLWQFMPASKDDINILCKTLGELTVTVSELTKKVDELQPSRELRHRTDDSDADDESDDPKPRSKKATKKTKKKGNTLPVHRDDARNMLMVRAQFSYVVIN